jgi:hypothetical protein
MALRFKERSIEPRNSHLKYAAAEDFTSKKDADEGLSRALWPYEKDYTIPKRNI